MVLGLFKEKSVSIGRSAVDVGLRKRGGSFKKDRTCTAPGACDLMKRCQAWFDGQLDLEPARLVFIDETGLSTKMSRFRERALCGQRCRSAGPHGHWKTTTFTDALGLCGIIVLDGAMNGVAFKAYVEQVLVPTLTLGDIVVT